MPDFLAGQAPPDYNYWKEDAAWIAGVREESVMPDDWKIEALRRAVMDAGPRPDHHYEVMARHQREWPVLWQAIRTLIQEEPK